MIKQNKLEEVVTQSFLSFSLSEAFGDLKKYLDEKFLTKEEARNFATRDDVQEIIREELKAYVTKEDLKEALKPLATKDDVAEMGEHVVETLLEEMDKRSEQINERFAQQN